MLLQVIFQNLFQVSLETPLGSWGYCCRFTDEEMEAGDGKWLALLAQPAGGRVRVKLKLFPLCAS